MVAQFWLSLGSGRHAQGWMELAAVHAPLQAAGAVALLAVQVFLAVTLLLDPPACGHTCQAHA